MELVEEHSDDFRLDPLLNIHIHHNLAEALLLTENSGQKRSISGNSEDLLPGAACDVDENNNHAIEREEMIRCNPSLKVISDDSLSVPSILLRKDETSSDFQPCISPYVQRLRIACEDHKQKFLSIFTSKLSLAQQEFRRSHEQVC